MPKRHDLNTELKWFEPSVASAEGEGKARSVYEDLVAVLFFA